MLILISRTEKRMKLINGNEPLRDKFFIALELRKQLVTRCIVGRHFLILQL